MKTEFISQYAHSWRVFERLVNDFEAAAWLTTGRKTITPARLSLHLLQAGQYYLKIPAASIPFASGKPFDLNWETTPAAELPSQDDILAGINELKTEMETWLAEMDFNAENTSFPWAGKTNLGLALFLLRHMLYHLGELSSLLNESKNGQVEDHYVKALNSAD